MRAIPSEAGKLVATRIRASQDRPHAVPFIQEACVFSTRCGNAFGSLGHSVFLVYFKIYLKEKHVVARRKML